ncbi:uncharacterized protein LODBEIA_P05110 [Lodderomyces beijingensis]|uniref:GATA-type domain-containing protein n=1 Tax=Lodderomyces beijingensis TaxID=1775926 RepID=A0ABP0ZJD3_9ASCO
MNRGVCHEAGAMPRLPSFQQLNETLKDTDTLTGPSAKNVLSYSSAFKNLALYQESKSAANNTNKAAATKAVGANPYNIGPEYSYGNTIYGRHESYPNQYYSLSYDGYRNKLDSTSPTSIDGMSKSDIADDEKIDDYKSLSNSIHFLTEFESKCRSTNAMRYCNYENQGPNASMVLDSMKNVSIDDILNTLKKTTSLLESMRPSKHEHEAQQEYNSSSKELKVFKRGLSHSQLSEMDKSKKPRIHHSVSFPSSSTSNSNINNNINNFNNSNNINNINNNNNRALPFEMNSIPLHEHLSNYVHEAPHHGHFGANGMSADMGIKPEIVCQHCLSHETPEWRRGPEGSRTLCNACGLFYSKLIKKYGLHEADRVMLERKQRGTVNDRRIF